VLEQAGEEASRALEELRELARGVFPPLLADRGLLAALGAQVRKVGMEVELEAAGLEERRLDGRLEAAAYFCCVGALQVAARLGAKRAGLRLWLEGGELGFAIRGWGLEREPVVEDGRGEVDRVEALNGTLKLHRIEGGLELVGRIPLPQPELRTA
jgi:signal transduction histidine kinase